MLERVGGFVGFSLRRLETVCKILFEYSLAVERMLRLYVSGLKGCVESTGAASPIPFYIRGGF